VAEGARARVLWVWCGHRVGAGLVPQWTSQPLDVRPAGVCVCLPPLQAWSTHLALSPALLGSVPLCPLCRHRRAYAEPVPDIIPSTAALEPRMKTPGLTFPRPHLPQLLLSCGFSSQQLLFASGFCAEWWEVGGDPLPSYPCCRPRHCFLWEPSGSHLHAQFMHFKQSLFLMILGFELEAFSLLGRCSAM
jgi:hypothetical protein